MPGLFMRSDHRFEFNPWAFLVFISVKTYTCIIWFNQHLGILILKDIYFHCNLFNAMIVHTHTLQVTSTWQENTKRLVSVNKRFERISTIVFHLMQLIWMFYASFRFRPHTNRQIRSFQKVKQWMVLKLYAIKHW